jgi:hypothetical protein
MPPCACVFIGAFSVPLHWRICIGDRSSGSDHRLVVVGERSWSTAIGFTGFGIG